MPVANVNVDIFALILTQVVCNAVAVLTVIGTEIS